MPVFWLKDVKKKQEAKNKSAEKPIEKIEKVEKAPVVIKKENGNG